MTSNGGSVRLVLHDKQGASTVWIVGASKREVMDGMAQRFGKKFQESRPLKTAQQKPTRQETKLQAPKAKATFGAVAA